MVQYIYLQNIIWYLQIIQSLVYDISYLHMRVLHYKMNIWFIHMFPIVYPYLFELHDISLYTGLLTDDWWDLMRTVDRQFSDWNLTSQVSTGHGQNHLMQISSKLFVP